MAEYKKKLSLIVFFLSVLLLVSCGSTGNPGTNTALPDKGSPGNVSAIGTRDSTPVCLVPRAGGNLTVQNDIAVIDYSNSGSGYIAASYTGPVSKVKMILIGPDNVKYTYDLHGNGYEFFPLSSGSGAYQVGIYENVSGTNYSTCLFTEFSAGLENEFGPFLYPNQYVNFHADSLTVAKGAELAKSADTDLDVIVNVYNYIISSITYDEAKAADPPTGYTTDVDAILSSGKGICLDYAAVMAAMLRSQGIPTRLEVGYAKDAYHAWISIYTEDTGWLNGLIEFTGNKWTLVDPTFGANNSEKALKKFIGDGSNYVLQKVY